MRLARRLAHWLRLSEVDVDLVDELAFHREMIERDLVARGMSPVDARDAARRTMGNETIMREESRGVVLARRSAPASTTGAHDRSCHGASSLPVQDGGGQGAVDGRAVRALRRY